MPIDVHIFQGVEYKYALFSTLFLPVSSQLRRSIMSQTVISKGIFHGLPTFPQHDGQKLQIIVTGANGISGSAMLKVLSEAPERWGKIYALSRRPLQTDYPSNVVPIAVDFLNNDPDEIARVLAKNQVKA